MTSNHTKHPTDRLPAVDPVPSPSPLPVPTADPNRIDSRAADWTRLAHARHTMVRNQLEAPGRGIHDHRVLRAMARVPRHVFVPLELLDEAYADHPLPIGFSQTISQPYIVGFMSQALQLRANDRVLEIGTGSGYQAAVLAEIVHEVHTCEIILPLAERAAATLRQIGALNVHVHHSDGGLGWAEAAPYDAVIVTCAPERIPDALVDQLTEGGRMIIPIGCQQVGQNLVLLRKHGSRIETESILPVRFVPMTGACEDTQGPSDDIAF